MFVVWCFSGVYELQLKAFVGRAVITGPQLIVSIQPDATKPVSFDISYKPQDTYTVGSLLPGNSVVLSTCLNCCFSSKSDNVCTVEKMCTYCTDYMVKGKVCHTP